MPLHVFTPSLPPPSSLPPSLHPPPSPQDLFQRLAERLVLLAKEDLSVATHLLHYLSNARRPPSRELLDMFYAVVQPGLAKLQPAQHPSLVYATARLTQMGMPKRLDFMQVHMGPYLYRTACTSRWYTFTDRAHVYTYV